MGASPSCSNKGVNGCPVPGGTPNKPPLVLLPSPDVDSSPNAGGQAAPSAEARCGQAFDLCCARAPGPDRFYTGEPSFDPSGLDKHAPVEVNAVSSLSKQAPLAGKAGHIPCNGTKAIVAISRLAAQAAADTQQVLQDGRFDIIPVVVPKPDVSVSVLACGAADDKGAAAAQTCDAVQEEVFTASAKERSPRHQQPIFNDAPSSEVSLGAGTALPPTEKRQPSTEAPSAVEAEETEQPIEFSRSRENLKSLFVTVVVALFFIVVIFVFLQLSAGFEDPVCLSAEELLANGDVSPDICDPCSAGGLMLPAFGEYENSLSKPFRAVLYLVGLLWVFLGIGVVCDQFMAAIEEITSAEKVLWLEVRQGAKHKFTVKVWNGTVANLTLMALGSSAPEILLNVVEICGSNFFAGELGPSTIVGSAAFNMLMITAVCVSALPPPETRKIASTDVFSVTCTMSLLAYLWLVVILDLHTPDLVEVWEAFATFAFFPLLVFVAFLADKGILFRSFQPARRVARTSQQDALQAKFGKELPVEALQLMIQQQELQEKPTNSSRAKLRAVAMRGFTGGRKNKDQDGTCANSKLFFGFKETEHLVLECAGTFQLKVVANRAPGGTVSMAYRTIEGSAKEGTRYTRVEGELKFGPHQLEKTIEIPIIDNDVWEENEDFYVELSQLQVLDKNVNIEPNFRNAMATVTILNDDRPGTLEFDADEVITREDTVTVIGVNRTSGSSGQISCRYHTANGTAVAGRSFAETQGTLTFEPDETHKTIEVQTLPLSHKFEVDEEFQIILDHASPGVKFDKCTDGGETSAICTVIIPANKRRSVAIRCLARIYNKERFENFLQDWSEQFTSAFYCNGSPADQVGAGLSDWFFHALSLFWKVLFAIVPPPSICGGWLCFWAALCMIGVVTAVVGDMAGLLGCCMGIPNDITAITLVALGTSLPDTFASKVAAQQDDTADNSVGNVTGSNSVNVFLGLGLPWSIGAVFWSITKRNEDWDSHVYKGSTFKELFASKYPSGGFMVPAGSLVFSVNVFVVCALLCVFLLIFRRRTYGGELGGPKVAQLRDSVLIALLWLMYLVASILKSVMSQ